MSDQSTHVVTVVLTHDYLRYYYDYKKYSYALKQYTVVYKCNLGFKFGRIITDLHIH